MKYPEIAAELLEMARVDQQMRQSIMETGAAFDTSVDVKNTRRLQEMVKMIGWPSVSLVGEEASKMAWLLVQHADHEVGFQKTCLGLMQQLLPGEVSLKNLAFLEDRICVNEGRLQRYGTQFFEEHGLVVPRPIEERETLNERREQMDLSPFEDYERSMCEKFGQLARRNKTF